MQVQESDMHRVATATGAQTQTTVNNLNPKVLGTVEAFEEKQVNAKQQSCYWMCLYAGEDNTLQMSNDVVLYNIHLGFVPWVTIQEGAVPSASVSFSHSFATTCSV